MSLYIQPNSSRRSAEYIEISLTTHGIIFRHVPSISLSFADFIVLKSSSSRLPAACNDRPTTRKPSGSHGFLRDLITSLSRRSESAAHGRPSSSHPLFFLRDLFPGRLLRRDRPDTELLKQKPVAVEVPYTRGKAVCFSFLSPHPSHIV